MKTNCVVLDFGTSVLTHGSLDDAVDLDGGGEAQSGDAPEKVCPECESNRTARRQGMSHVWSHVFEGADADPLDNFEMTEVDLMERSPFRWVDLFGNGACLAATGFNCFALIAEVDELSMAIVKRTNSRVRLISVGTKKQAMAAADDYMRQHESSDSAKKTKRWLNDPVSDKQRSALGNAVCR